MARLTKKAAILGVKDVVTEEVNVPEWGGSVLLRVMSGADRGRIEELQQSGKLPFSQIRQIVLIACICDDDGERVFGDADIEALGKKNGRVLDRLFDVAQRLNRMRGEDVEAEKKAAGEPD